MPWTAICYCNIYCWCGGKGTLARLGFPSMHAAHPVSRGWRMHFGVAQGGRAATLMRLGSHSPPLATSLPRWLGHAAPRWRRAKPPRPRTPQRVGKKQRLLRSGPARRARTMGAMQQQSRRTGAPPRHCDARLRGRDCCCCCAAPYPREKLNDGCPMIASAILRQSLIAS